MNLTYEQFGIHWNIYPWNRPLLLKRSDLTIQERNIYASVAWADLPDEYKQMIHQRTQEWK